MHVPNEAATLADLGCFHQEYQDKYLKAVECLLKDQETLFAFMAYPAAHGVHLRATSVIESSFATVKDRTRTTRGAGSWPAGLAFAFKLSDLGQETLATDQCTALVAPR